MSDSFKLLEHLKETIGEEEIAALSKEVEKLLLSSLENPFPQKGGFLDKLCFYCDILLQASKISNETLPMILEDMRNSVLRLRAKVLPSKKFPGYPQEIRNQIFGLYEEIEQKFRLFFSALVPYLQEARTDENILIHLIEQKQTLNRYLGLRSIENLLRRFFPTGQPHLRAVICEGFTRRGFTSFFSEKEPLIEDLEWETPCHPPTTH